MPSDEEFMLRALTLARRGLALTSPNPNVGCILVKDEKIIGEGWHEFDMLDHAEVAAIKSAQASGHSTEGATAYITLEPCNHTGRTPPCTDALIAAKIRRAVIATVDPNPQVSGSGIAHLKDAGIEVTTGICESEARRLNEPFACFITSRRPFVHMKVAMTLDGRIAPPAGHHIARQPYWITNELSRAAVQQLRHQADAVLTGVDTVIADDPLLTDRSNLPRRRPLLRVILDSALRMPLDCKLVATANNDLLIVTLTQAPAASPLAQKAIDAHAASTRSLESRGIRVLALKPEHGRVPLNALLSHLAEENILTLFTEAGTRLNTALLEDHLVDRIQLFCAPQVMGSDAVPAFKSLSPALKLQNIELARYGDDLGISCLLNDPWQ
jgi:diaminohydroxyphosphoribosylaminopyrimidine deaminase/5-amino-6-(5-phosphoribosylamino)uracil reductase